MKPPWSLKFHTKLVLTYLIFIMGILVISSTAAYLYFKQFVMKKAQEESMQIAVEMQNKLEDTMKEMETIADSLQEDNVVMEQMRRCDTENITAGNRLEHSYALKIALLDSMGPYSNLHRVSVLNDKGDFVSTNNIIYNAGEIADMVKKADWYTEIVGNHRDSLFIYDHYDQWMNAKYTKMFSYVKPLVSGGGIVGFVEIQSGVDIFGEMVTNQEATRMIVSRENEVLFSNRAFYGQFAAAVYRSAIGREQSGIKMIVNPITQNQQMMAFTVADKGLSILIAQDVSLLMKAVYTVKQGVVFTILGIFIVSMIFVYVFSKKLTIPLRRLKSVIDSTDSVDLTETPREEKAAGGRGGDEVALIEDSFYKMQSRLKNAMAREIQLRSMQNKAHFDALQARINPHFLYNTLGVIGGMCYEASQCEIGEMCASLAQMFRYSTANADSPATLGEELAHARDYLLLMKKRYEHRLEYMIEADDALLGRRLPKLVIQPMIENSIIHGFQNQWVEVIRIQVKVSLDKGGRICIAVADNGKGFDQEVLAGLQEKIAKYRRQVARREELEAAKGKNMGILNTFVRICLYFNGEAGMQLENLPDTGARVVIWIPAMEGEGEDVSGNGGG